MRVGRAGVVGAGTMGAALAELLALNGIDVVLKDVRPDLVERGLARVRALVGELVGFHEGRAEREIGRIEAATGPLSPAQRERARAAFPARVSREEGEQIVARVHGTTAYDAFAEVDFVLEAVFEELEVKRAVLKELDAVVPSHAVLGSNTSSLSITRLARGLSHAPETVVTHFFNPPSTLPLVEVVPGLDTRDDVTEEVMDFVGSLRNHRYPLVPVRVKESPGFVVNRILLPVLNEATFVLQEGVASMRDVDLAMKSGAGLPMGPFELADLIGLDVTLEVAETMHRETGDPKYRPSVLLRQLVDAGRLGRKSGRGFYEYP